MANIQVEELIDNLHLILETFSGKSHMTWEFPSLCMWDQSSNSLLAVNPAVEDPIIGEWGEGDEWFTFLFFACETIGRAVCTVESFSNIQSKADRGE